MPHEMSPGKPTTRRYREAEKARAVRAVRQLRTELGTDHGAVKRVADQLASAASGCTADEINIAIAIRLLRRDGVRPNGPDRVLDELIDQNATSDPDTDPGYDLATALELARDELVDDIDIDHLWNPALDGIGNDTALQHHWRMTNLHPTTWFDHFRTTR